MKMITIKVVKFKNHPDLILSTQQWDASGGWKGLIKSCAFPLNDVVCVEQEEMTEAEFDDLSEWEG